MVQFTDDPRTEFKLNAYNTKETLLDAIKRISYKGGNTKTGENNKSKTQSKSSLVITEMTFWRHKNIDFLKRCFTDLRISACLSPVKPKEE